MLMLFVILPVSTLLARLTKKREIDKKKGNAGKLPDLEDKWNEAGMLTSYDPWKHPKYRAAFKLMDLTAAANREDSSSSSSSSSEESSDSDSDSDDMLDSSGEDEWGDAWGWDDGWDDGTGKAKKKKKKKKKKKTSKDKKEKKDKMEKRGKKDDLWG